MEKWQMIERRPTDRIKLLTASPCVYGSAASAPKRFLSTWKSSAAQLLNKFSGYRSTSVGQVDMANYVNSSTYSGWCLTCVLEVVQFDSGGGCETPGIYTSDNRAGGTANSVTSERAISDVTDRVTEPSRQQSLSLSGKGWAWSVGTGHLFRGTKIARTGILFVREVPLK